MNVKEELTKLLMESYDQGAADAKQEALAALEQVVAVAIAKEREAFAVHAVDIARRAIAEEREAIRTELTRIVIVPTLTHGTLVKLSDVDATILARGQA